jgi:hypothetical protein
MKLPINLLLRSMGAPAAIVELYELFEAQGLQGFCWQPARDDDPNWAKIGASEDRTRHGIWIRAEGPNSRFTAAFFIEGMDDETLKAFTAQFGDQFGAPVALPDGSQPS